MINVFELVQRDQLPMTFFANDEQQAQQLFWRWMATHLPGQEVEIPMIHVYRDALLEKRGLLFDAACFGKVGVGYWDGDAGIWRVEDPEREMTGTTARPSSGVHCFRVEVSPGAVLMAFAPNQVVAVDFVLGYCLATKGEAPYRMDIRRHSPWSLVNVMAVLRDEMEDGACGLASWTQEQGWRIAAPEFTMDVSDF